jgi:hypothetical protein
MTYSILEMFLAGIMSFATVVVAILTVRELIRMRGYTLRLRRSNAEVDREGFKTALASSSRGAAAYHTASGMLIVPIRSCGHVKYMYLRDGRIL